MKTTYNLRAIAANVIGHVLDKGQSLSSLLPQCQQNTLKKDRALLQELCFGVLRVLPQLEWIIQQLIAKPLIGKQRTLHYLIMVGIYQLAYTRIPTYAALSETVNGAIALKHPKFKGLVNGVLRQFERQQVELNERAENHASRFAHPEWLLSRLKKAYPQQWQKIVNANNQRPPMCLRVNRLHHTRKHYLTLLSKCGIAAQPHAEQLEAIMLSKPCAVNQLPGFTQGWVTVQDASAQGCVRCLSPQDNEHILDLCAAPGGKTTHILEIAPHAKLLAVDIDPRRLARVKENLQRLSMHANVRQGDGREPSTWCDEQLFDRILLDAPCSATGVILRHPDIKWLRRDSDIANLALLQQELLEAIWPRLKIRGTLVYATCSVLPEENQQQIRAFLTRHTDAHLVEPGNMQHPGLQKLPTPADGDGFFYAKLVKSIG
ncbi:MAG: 16S rRNA (cytosine(967)-C(5))-methyltransferase RsmB [Candidatus Malihini olakiniferum]